MNFCFEIEIFYRFAYWIYKRIKKIDKELFIKVIIYIYSIKNLSLCHQRMIIYISVLLFEIMKHFSQKSYRKNLFQKYVELYIDVGTFTTDLLRFLFEQLFFISSRVNIIISSSF